MRILGPLVWLTTLPVTATLPSASASAVTSVPSTTSSAGKLTSVPGSPSSFSTWTTSPTATLYCLPPVLTIAYIGTEVSCYSTITGVTRAPLTDESKIRAAEPGSRMTEPTGMAGRLPGYGAVCTEVKPGSTPHCPVDPAGGPAGRDAARRRVGRGGLATATAGGGLTACWGIAW